MYSHQAASLMSIQSQLLWWLETGHLLVVCKLLRAHASSSALLQCKLALRPLLHIQ